ncbi:MAG: polysaccharide pyruvyl transferase family protein [Actinomycetaceae bacterium]|nr:polysaccharide pyruvyl transferase family protein [Actinomycetaceae bacterium]
MTTVAVLADIGHGAHHVGDDAIAMATHDLLVSRGITPVMLSHNEDDSRRLLPDAQFYTTPIFSFNPRARRQMYHQTKTEPNSGLCRLVEPLLDRVDGVVIAGGGSLNSYYGWLAFERAFLAQQAWARQLPVVISGHSFGPLILDEDVGIFADLARATTVAGFRGPISVQRAREYGFASALQTCDDVITMATGKAQVGESFISACFAEPEYTDMRGAVVCQYAAVLDYLAQKLGAFVKLTPHMANPATGDRDLAFHREIANACSAQCQVEPLVDPLETMRSLDGAVLTVTSRFHQAVFSFTNQIPLLPLSFTPYGTARMGDLLENYGFAAAWTLPLVALQGANLAWMLDDFLDSLPAQTQQLGRSAPTVLAHHGAWWDGIAQGFEDGSFAGISPLSSADLLAPPTAFTQVADLSNSYLQLVDEKISRDLQNSAQWKEIAELAPLAERASSLSVELAQLNARKVVRVADFAGDVARRAKRLFS